MLRPITRTLAIVLTLPSLVLAAGPKDDEAKAVAVKVTTAGASLFDAKDAPALAATFTEEARLEVTIKEKDTNKYNTEVKQGRTQIEAYYRELFKSDATYHAKNTIEFAKEIAPDLILFTGIFETDSQAAEPLKLPFIQVRKKNGEAWQVVSMQVFVVLDK